jgi:hypothetical protein
VAPVPVTSRRRSGPTCPSSPNRLTALVATVLPAAPAWVITGLILLTVFALANAS